MHKGIIDRFEGSYAIIEMFEQDFMEFIPIAALPTSASTGDVIIVHDNHKITIDSEETTTRKAEIDMLANELFEE